MNETTIVRQQDSLMSYPNQPTYPTAVVANDGSRQGFNLSREEVD